MKKLLTLTLIVLSLVMVASPAVVSAATAKDSVCAGIGLTGGTSDCKPPADGPTVQSTLQAAISILSYLIGFAAVVMLMIAGFKFITAGGEPAKIASARDTILYSVIGLVVAMLAQLIVNFVLTNPKL